MAVNISFLDFFVPLLGFVLVFVVVYALLATSKILGGLKWANVIVSLIVAIMFATATSVRSYVEAFTPWVAVLLISSFFVVLLIGFSYKEGAGKFLGSWFSIVVFIILILIFLISAVNVFGDRLTPYIPGYSESGGSPALLVVKHFLTSSQILGAIIFIIVVVIVSVLMTKGK